VAQPLRLQGQYWDQEIGLCYNRYRYFDPHICSFISQDPIGLAGGENVYAYAPNVWGWVDPLGLCAADAAKPDFIVSSDGAVVHNSPEKVRSSLDSAGLQNRSVQNPAGTETGTVHNIPDMKMDARVMDGGPNHPARVVTSRQGTSQPVNPANGSNFGNIPKVEQRERSHISFP
jgi:RHS repeat-associated protein